MNWLTLAQETQTVSSDQAKIILAAIIIMALWGQKIDRGGK